ncbi:NAD(P)H-dependent oxidoreductase [Marinilactibacillus psychrotolerans]|uniref:NAD(P)H-dependent oxidoreductase n=1 Tax=Marinilactibacillus psychrotolerans TaxID=191770 RepID=A0ABW8UIM1_9LACT
MDRGIKKHSDLITVHELTKEYHNPLIDVKAEHSLIESHKNLVFHFPVYWLNFLSLLKQWLDEFLINSCAFGRSGTHVKNLKIVLAVTVRSECVDYDKECRYNHSLEKVLAPFKLTVKYCKADYQKFFAYYNSDSSPSAEITRSAKNM